MDIAILERWGLHENDIAVYEALFTLGKSKTGAIINESGVGSSQTYLALSRLVKRGLVSYQVRNNVRYYQAELPDTLIEETKRGVIELEQLSEELKNQKEEKPDRNFVNTFEGKSGFKKAFLHHIDAIAPKEQISIIGYTQRVPNLRELRAFLKKSNELIEAKGSTMRMILDERFKNSLGEREGPAYDVRFLPSRYFTPTAVSLCQKEVVLSVWGENPLAISISEPAVVKSFAQNFETLWEIAEKK